jgi:Phosphotransferase enzyme family
MKPSSTSRKAPFRSMSRARRPSATDSPLHTLEGLVREVVHAPATVEVHEKRMKSGVYRLRCTINGTARSFVGKRLDPNIARRNELVARRWLPAVGLGDSGPPLLAVAAERDASSVWHLYDDLGDCGLDVSRGDPDRVGPAVAAIARIHTRFEGHALIPECRLWGGDLGINFYVASVRDAITSLGAVRARKGRLGVQRLSLCDRLLARLANLSNEQVARAEALERYGGPETLLHGDLWPMNVMVCANGREMRARLIDWDHAAVGPVSYDLSTFLHRFPDRDRTAILRLYEEEVGRAGWRLPSTAELNVLFETAELARIANRVIWPALALREDDADWAFAELGEVERWFEQLTPILPLDDTCVQS